MHTEIQIHKITHISTPQNTPTLTYIQDTHALKGENEYMLRDRKIIHNKA